MSGPGVLLRKLEVRFLLFSFEKLFTFDVSHEVTKRYTDQLHVVHSENGCIFNLRSAFRFLQEF